MRMPAIFFGHGNPMNAILENPYSQAWARIGRELPRPKAIVCISAHWYLPATLVTANERPRLDHGTWSVLVHVFPDADIPIVQLSIDETQPAQSHYDLGRKLAPLRGDAVTFPVEGIDGGSVSTLTVRVD